MSNKICIELRRSLIGTPEWMRTIVRTLGLSRPHDRVVLPDSPATRGNVKKLPHLLVLTEVRGQESSHAS